LCTTCIYKDKMKDNASFSDFILAMARLSSVRQPARTRPGLWLQRPQAPDRAMRRVLWIHRVADWCMFPQSAGAPTPRASATLANSATWWVIWGDLKSRGVSGKPACPTRERLLCHSTRMFATRQVDTSTKIKGSMSYLLGNLCVGYSSFVV
jgi:hypothetical protein